MAWANDDLITLLRALTPTSPGWRHREAEAQAELEALPTSALAHLDYDMRWRAAWSTHTWESMTVEEARHLLVEAAHRPTVAAALSMHPRGLIRELAVTGLGRGEPQAGIRWLMLRCGDWVPQVRDAARAALDQWLTPANADALLDSLPLVDGGRFDAGRPAADLRARIRSVVSDPASRPAVERGTRSPIAPVRRACVRILADAGADVSLLEQVMATNDVVAIATAAAAHPTRGPSNRAVGEILLRSSMARFRSEGLWRLTVDDPPGSEALARHALADPAPSVRDVAHRWLSGHGVDTAAVYRSMLAEAPLVALRGLGDRPRPDDAAIARGFVDSTRGPIRAAALRIVAGAPDRDDGPLFAHRFMAGTAAERRYALVGLRGVGVGPFVDLLWAAARARAGGDPGGDAGGDAGSDHRPAERVLFQVLPLAGRWQRIEVALEAVAARDPVLRRMGFEALQGATIGWNRGPTWAPSDRSGLQLRFDAARPVFAQPDQHPAQEKMLAFLEQLLGR